MAEASGKSSAPIAVKTNLIAGTTWACCWEAHSFIAAEPVQSTVHPSRFVELTSSKEPKGLEIYHWPPMKCPSKSLHIVRRPTLVKNKFLALSWTEEDGRHQSCSPSDKKIPSQIGAWEVHSTAINSASDNNRATTGSHEQPRPTSCSINEEFGQYSSNS